MATKQHLGALRQAHDNGLRASPCMVKPGGHAYVPT